jgi:hypothetical protein
MIMLVLCTCRMGSVVPFTVVEGPEAWVAADYQDPASYSYTLTPGNIAELDAAVAGVLQRGLDIQVHLPDLSSCHASADEWSSPCIMCAGVRQVNSVITTWIEVDVACRTSQGRTSRCPAWAPSWWRPGRRLAGGVASSCSGVGLFWLGFWLGIALHHQLHTRLHTPHWQQALV